MQTVTTHIQRARVIQAALCASASFLFFVCAYVMPGHGFAYIGAAIFTLAVAYAVLHHYEQRAAQHNPACPECKRAFPRAVQYCPYCGTCQRTRAIVPSRDYLTLAERVHRDELARRRKRDILDAAFYLGLLALAGSALAATLYILPRLFP